MTRTRGRVALSLSILVTGAIVATLTLPGVLDDFFPGGAWSAQAAGPAEPAPDDPESLAHLRRGVELAQEGRNVEAIAEFRRCLAALPANADAHFLLGRSLLAIAVKEQASFDQAVSEFQDALRLDPSRDYVRLQLAEIFGRRIPGAFMPDRAVDLYGELISRNPDRTDFHLQFAKWIFASEARLKRAGDRSRVYQDSAWAMDVARLHLEKVIDQSPRDSDAGIEARSFLAEVQYRMGEWEAARTTLGELIARLQPAAAGTATNLAPAWNTIGHCNYRAGDFGGAAKAFRKACELQPTLPYLYDLRMAWDAQGGYPKEIPDGLRFPLREENYDRASPPLLKFTDIAPQLHIDKFAGAGPGSWADYNLDGKPDLIACGCDTFCTLYRAEGSGFVDATIEAKLSRTEPGFGAVWGDFDNDGDPDLYIARNGWNGPAPNSLLRNNGDATFTDVGAAAGVDDRGSSFNAAWFDYDHDGWLDLIVTNGVYVDGSNNQLYRNKGDGTFTNVTAAAGLTESSGYGTIGVAVGDYDDDGWPDIFFNGRMIPNRLYRNNHDGTFTNVAARARVLGPGTQNGYIAFFADLDSDGDLDIWTGSLAPWEQVLAGYRSDFTGGPVDHIPRFFRNRGDGTFSDDSLSAGWRYPLGIMAAGVADLDNDGYIDVYLGTGNPELRRVEPNIFYQNRKGRSFEDLTRFSGLGNLGKGHGITFIDWDGDGDLDIYAELGGFFHGDWWHNAFYRNELGSRNHWLNVSLRQPGTNRDAIGARVTVRAGALSQVQEVTAGRGFGSCDPRGLHFGLGSATKIDRLEIRWPLGEAQTIAGLSANRTVSIVRGETPPK